jgi:hypothetical protein
MEFTTDGMELTTGRMPMVHRVVATVAGRGQRLILNRCPFRLIALSTSLVIAVLVTLECGMLLVPLREHIGEKIKNLFLGKFIEQSLWHG